MRQLLVHMQMLQVLLLQQLALFQKPKEPIILQLVHILHLKVTHRQLLAQMQMLLEITR